MILKKWNRIEPLHYVDAETSEVLETVMMRRFYASDGKILWLEREYQLSLEEQGLIDKETFRWIES